ncbi:hypothetical protein AK830_g11659 [Neonectria ditissima]|uniref:FAS1 domain-containing protein n=1 Tax=Neonectria ditissima TaxID=78410 RepID=A0A0N8H516_9HYPO|nr:hypothetical protein AK830_g11659 [Neonectria ditissima]
MKLTTFLTFVTAASATAILKDIEELLHDKVSHTESLIEDARSNIASSFDEAINFLSSGIENAIRTAENAATEEFSGLFGKDPSQASSFGYDVDFVDHDKSNYTILELISESNYTKEFYKLVKDHKSVTKLLNSTENEYTLFVPIDKAFEDIPEDHKKPSDEFIESVLDYHVALGSWPASTILTTHTIPTSLKEELLGGNPQRLRTSIGLSGVRINVYSKVVGVNYKAKNGYIHAVNKILIPPTYIGREISLFPSAFSTLLLAYDRTDFVKYIHGIKMVGSTVFAPSNKAWESLGPRTNAFLFNTEKGHKYLNALLKYQIVPNITLYSDEIYYSDEANRPVAQANSDHFHLELGTLLEKSLGVDVYIWNGWRSIVVNGATKVGFQDGIGKNGVIQVIEGIPIPPHRKGGKSAEILNEEIEVEDLKERLREYVEDDKEEEEYVNDL